MREMDGNSQGNLDDDLITRARALAAAAVQMAENLNSIGPIKLPDLSSLEVSSPVDDQFEAYKRENWDPKESKKIENSHVNKPSKQPKIAHNKFSQIKTPLPPLSLPDMTQVTEYGGSYSSRLGNNSSSDARENYQVVVAERALNKKKEDDKKYLQIKERTEKEKELYKKNMEMKALELKQKTAERISEYNRKKAVQGQGSSSEYQSRSRTRSPSPMRKHATVLSAKNQREEIDNSTSNIVNSRPRSPSQRAALERIKIIKKTEKDKLNSLKATEDAKTAAIASEMAKKAEELKIRTEQRVNEYKRQQIAFKKKEEEKRLKEEEEKQIRAKNHLIEADKKAKRLRRETLQRIQNKEIEIYDHQRRQEVMFKQKLQEKVEKNNYPWLSSQLKDPSRNTIHSSGGDDKKRGNNDYYNEKSSPKLMRSRSFDSPDSRTLKKELSLGNYDSFIDSGDRENDLNKSKEDDNEDNDDDDDGDFLKDSLEFTGTKDEQKNSSKHREILNQSKNLIKKFNSSNDTSTEKPMNHLNVVVTSNKDEDDISCITVEKNVPGKNSSNSRKKWGEDNNNNNNSNNFKSKKNDSVVPIWKKLEPIPVRPFVKPPAINK